MKYTSANYRGSRIGYLRFDLFISCPLLNADDYTQSAVGRVVRGFVSLAHARNVNYSVLKLAIKFS